MNDPGVGRNFNLGDIFKVALRWWECDFVIVLWVLMVQLWRYLKFWCVLERSIEKWFWWKMNNPRVGRNFHVGDIFKVALRWWECDYVIVLWVTMMQLWRSLEFWCVLERSIEKWFWWKMNDPGVGRNFNLGDILKVALRWWECEYVIVFGVLMVKLWRTLEFWVF